ncbi:MAG: hypothetical protein OXR66_04295 [Candidatus Woesearchaeota archaeon]|nr:hypothetical protein [Candidatus Woesearchaeota archaeon]
MAATQKSSTRERAIELAALPLAGQLASRMEKPRHDIGEYLARFEEAVLERSSYYYTLRPADGRAFPVDGDSVLAIGGRFPYQPITFRGDDVEVHSHLAFLEHGDTNKPLTGDPGYYVQIGDEVVERQGTFSVGVDFFLRDPKVFIDLPQKFGKFMHHVSGWQSLHPLD